MTSQQEREDQDQEQEQEQELQFNNNTLINPIIARTGSTERVNEGEDPLSVSRVEAGVGTSEGEREGEGELERGDISISNHLSSRTTRIATVSPTRRITSLEEEIPSLESILSEPALPLPLPPSVLISVSLSPPSSSSTSTGTHQPISNSDRRTLATIHTNNNNNYYNNNGLTSPRLLPGGSPNPRTRFDLSGRGTSISFGSPVLGGMGVAGAGAGGSPGMAGGIPLKPILNLPPKMEEMDLGEAALLWNGNQSGGEGEGEGRGNGEGGGRQQEEEEEENDEMDLEPLDSLDPNHPSYYHRRLFDGDDLIPERTIHSQIRTPHPLYTPLINPRIARRRRRRAMSIHSTRVSNDHHHHHKSTTIKTFAKSGLRSAWNLLRLKKFKHRSSGKSNGTSSSIRTGTSHSNSSNSSRSTSSSRSDSSSTSSSSSGRSNSTWGGWKFWKNDSDSDSDSNSNDSNSSDNEDDDEFIPPTPHFTLLTPSLIMKSSNTSSTTPATTSGTTTTTTTTRTATTTTGYPDHLLPSNSIDKSLPLPTPLLSPSPSPSPTPSSSILPLPPPSPSNNNTNNNNNNNKSKPFELSTTSTLTPALERLQSFWLEKRQIDSVAGDLGLSALSGGGGGYSTPLDTEEPSAGLGLGGGGVGGGGRKLRGEARGAKAERLRLGLNTTVEEGPAWWLDVMCPTVADMREIRKLLPLHPLTMEDILQQETREKMESFPSLGYYFVVFRALDESYFRYTSPDDENDPNNKGNGNGNGIGAPGLKGRVDIVEGVGGKEGVEGVGVGAVNLYLVVFPDGIISFHFEDISKHVEKVQGRIHQLSVSRTMSSHWIAYSLMDSIVDAFFPLIDYVEGESNDVDSFLTDPLNSTASGTRKPVLLQPEQRERNYDEKISAISVVVEPTIYGTSEDEEEEEEEEDGKKLPALISTRTTVTKRFKSSILKGFPKIVLPSILIRILPAGWTESTLKSYNTTVVVTTSKEGIPVGSYSPSLDEKVLSSNQRRKKYTKFDRAAMLKRITDARKLVTGLSRILGPKLDVVKALKKRMKLEHDTMFRSGDNQDIEIYIGDLSDHISAMHQSLVFYEAILAHDHPAYLGILRLSLHDAKGGTDIGILQLYVVTLTIIPMNIVIGIFSLNVTAASNGSRGDHLLEDGTLAGFSIFGMVIAGIFCVGVFMTLLMRFMIKSAKQQHVRKGPPIVRS